MWSLDLVRAVNDYEWVWEFLLVVKWSIIRVVKKMALFQYTPKPTELYILKGKSIVVYEYLIKAIIEQQI